MSFERQFQAPREMGSQQKSSYTRSRSSVFGEHLIALVLQAMAAADANSTHDALLLATVH
jgi:hypothetical protein